VAAPVRTQHPSPAPQEEQARQLETFGVRLRPAKAGQWRNKFWLSAFRVWRPVLIRYLSPFMTHPYHIYLLPTVSAMTALSAFL
jgi:hypothetical protein